MRENSFISKIPLYLLEKGIAKTFYLLDTFIPFRYLLEKVLLKHKYINIYKNLI